MRRLLTAGLVCLVTAACGGGSGGGSPIAPTPPAPTFFSNTVTGNLAANTGNFHPLTVARGGNLALDLSWPGGSDLDLYLTDTGCTDIFLQRTCQTFGTADSFNLNPERIARTVNGGSFNVWVVNASTGGAAVNYTLSQRIDYTLQADATTGGTTSLVTRGGSAVGNLKIR